MFDQVCVSRVLPVPSTHRLFECDHPIYIVVLTTFSYSLQISIFSNLDTYAGIPFIVKDKTQSTQSVCFKNLPQVKLITVRIDGSF